MIDFSTKRTTESGYQKIWSDTTYQVHLKAASSTCPQYAMATGARRMMEPLPGSGANARCLGLMSLRRHPVLICTSPKSVRFRKQTAPTLVACIVGHGAINRRYLFDSAILRMALDVGLSSRCAPRNEAKHWCNYEIIEVCLTSASTYSLYPVRKQGRQKTRAV